MSHSAGSGIASGVVAGILLVTFIGICMWAYSRSRRAAFDTLSRLPLEEDDEVQPLAGPAAGGAS